MGRGVIFIILFIITLTFVRANIEGSVYQIEETPEEDLFIPVINATLKFYSIENNSYEVETNEKGEFYFDEKLNISFIEVIKNGEVVANNSIDYNPNESVKIDFRIYVEKITHSSEKVLSKDPRYTESSIYPSYNLYHGYYILSFWWIDEPPDYQKRPVLLVHGWSNNAYIGKNKDWGSLESTLKDRGKEVWRLQYAPANLDNRFNAGMINDAINELLNKGYRQNYANIDVVAHSMGGVAVRGYIQNMAISQSGYNRPYNNNIRKLILLASPMQGSYYANMLNNGDAFPISCYIADFINIFNKYFVKSDSTLNLEIGSDFLWELNRQPINTDIDYLTISGKNTYSFCLNNGGEKNDGIVSLISSSLINEGYPWVIKNIQHSSIPLIVTGINEDKNVGEIINLFLNNALNPNSVRSYLDNSIGEVYYDPKIVGNAPYELNDFGSEIVQFYSPGVIVNSALLKFGGSSYFLQKNQNTERWIYVRFNDFNDFTTLIPRGNYDLIINGLDSKKDVRIFSGKVNLDNISFDDDIDGYSDKAIGGTDCNDYQTLIYPGAPEKCNNIDDDCDNSISDDGISETWYNQQTTCGIGTCQRTGNLLCINGQQNDSCIPGIPTTENCGDELDNDCDGLVDYNDTKECIPLILSLNNPKDRIYNYRMLNLDLNSNVVLNKMEFIDNSESRPHWTTLCTNCKNYNRLRNFNDGEHNLTFRGLLNDKNISNQTLIFIDSKDPQISTTKPGSMKYTNGSGFYIKLKEDNLKEITINFNPTFILDLEDCSESKEYKECYINLNLSNYDKQNISYYFKVTDIANNTDESRPIKIKVDTTSPKITNFTAPIVGKYVYLNMTILNEDKLSFDRVEYIDNSESKPKLKSLCTSLKNNICYKKVSFKTGNHNITIHVLDEAGNSDQKNVIIDV